MSGIETFEENVQIWNPTSFKVNEQGRRLLLTSQFHTSQIIPKDILRRDFKTGLNKEVRCFHITPESDTRSFVGVVHDLWWDDDIDEPMVTIDLNEDTATADRIREIIVEDSEKPLGERRIKGISAGIIASYDKKTKEIVKFHVREVSLAREPVCEPCTFQDIQIYEKQGINMSDMDKVIGLFESLQGTTLKTLQKTIESQGSTIDELENKIERYEKTIEIQHKELLDNKKILGERETDIQTFEKKLEDQTKEYESSARKPLVARLLKYEKFDPKTEDGKKRLDELMEENSKSLTNMIKGFERLETLAKKGLVTQPTGNFADLDGLSIQNFDNISPEERVKATNQALASTSGRVAGEIRGAFDGGM